VRSLSVVEVIPFFVSQFLGVPAAPVIWISISRGSLLTKESFLVFHLKLVHHFFVKGP